MSERTKVKVGQRYGKLVVSRRVENYQTPGGVIFSKWACKCDCGNEVEVLGTSLTAHHTTSCGCGKYEPKVKSDTMMNKKFGMLTVVSRAPSHKIPSGSVYDMWNCVCECGNHTVSFGRHLRTGKTVSCGCQRAKNQAMAGKTPKAETWMKEYLDDKNIQYEYQKTFPDLIGVNGGLLSYDFYIPSRNMLIELHGLQHYKPVEWFGGEDGFNKQVNHDILKTEYAKKNGYKLCVIPTSQISKKRFLEQIIALKL